MTVNIADRAEAGAAVAEAARGLFEAEKRLPPWLLYDAEGSRLFERITQLETYYLTRAERNLLVAHAPAIVRAAAPVGEIVELGAGTSTKSEILLAALRRPVRYVPVDVSPEPVAHAATRLTARIPGLVVAPMIATNEAALEALRPRPGRLALFLGSSIGNLEDADAIALLRRVRRVAGGLLLGADLRKAPATLVAAYDDPVTERFIRNVLDRLNRELGAAFDQGAIRYVPAWNDAASRMEMYLESTRDQRVPIAALRDEVRLRAGERIHVESSRKYDLPTLDGLLAAAGYTRAQTWDAHGAYVLVLARGV